MKRIVILPGLKLTEALNESTHKILQIKGRSRRSEFWWTILIVFLANIILTPIAGLFLNLATIPLTIRRLHDIGKSGWWYGLFYILKFFLLVCLFADLFIIIANTKSHIVLNNPIEFIWTFIIKYIVWIIFIHIYQIVLLIFLCSDSEQETNKYGESPKYRTIDNEDEESCAEE